LIDVFGWESSAEALEVGAQIVEILHPGKLFGSEGMTAPAGISVEVNASLFDGSDRFRSGG